MASVIRTTRTIGRTSCTRTMWAPEATAHAIAAAVQQIAASAEKVQADMTEVAAVAEQSSASSEQVSASTEQTSASAQEIASSAQQLAGTATELEQLVGLRPLDGEHRVVAVVVGEGDARGRGSLEPAYDLGGVGGVGDDQDVLVVAVVGDEVVDDAAGLVGLSAVITVTVNNAAPPGPQDSYGIAYDMQSQRAIMFGGHVAENDLTWAYDPADAQSSDHVRALFDRQLQDQVDAGPPDFWIGETFSYLGEALLFVERAKRTGLPVMVTMSFETLPAKAYEGDAPGEVAKKLAEAGADVVGVDWRVPLDEGWRRVPGRGVQGNLDPAALFAPRAELERQVRDVLRRAAGRPGHVFNLGHGILPGTPVDNVRAVVDVVHEWAG